MHGVIEPSEEKKKKSRIMALLSLRVSVGAETRTPGQKNLGIGTKTEDKV